MFKLFKAARFLLRNRWRLVHALTREVADIVEEEHANHMLLESFTQEPDRKTYEMLQRFKSFYPRTYDQIGREVVSVEPMGNEHGEPWFGGTRRFG